MLLDDTNTLYVDDRLIDKSIQAWFEYSDRQPARKRLQLALAAGGELNQHLDSKMWDSAVDDSFRRYAHGPSYMQENGKPVFFWYIEKDVEPLWNDAR